MKKACVKLGIATGALAMLSFGSAAQAISVTGTIYEDGPNLSVDYWDFVANNAGNVIIDILAYDIDLGNGTSYLDSYIYLFSDDGSLDTSDFLGYNDDFYDPATNGSIYELDSYLSVFLNPGNYRLAISGFGLNGFSLEEAIAGIQTDSNSGYLFNKSGDYQIDFIGDIELAGATPVPTPALLPGLIAMGVATLRKKREEETAQ